MSTSNLVFPESGSYAQTWANRIATNLAAGRSVISTHYDPGAYAALPLAEPFQEAFPIPERGP